MSEPLYPNNEIDRLKAIDRYDVLNTLPEEDLDNIAHIASFICNTPISLITIVDRDCQLFKSHIGLDITETSRDISFCAHAINDPFEIFEVVDARLDKRFQDNPLVTGHPNIVFYAGMPLVTNDGFALGTLCVLDNKPQVLNDGQKESLKRLSKQVMLLLEAKEKRKLEQRLNLVDFIFKNASIPTFIVKEDASFLDLNEVACTLLGYSREELILKRVIDLDEEYNEKKWPIHWDDLKNAGRLTIETKLKKKDESLLDIIVNANYIKYGEFELNCSFLTDVTKKKISEEQKLLYDFTIKNSSLPVAYIKEDATYYSCNKAFANLYGYDSIGEILNKNLYEFGTNFTPETWKIYWAELKEKGSLNFTAKREKKDGTIIDVEINPNYLQFGDLGLNCVFVKDVTEKKKLDEKLNFFDFLFRNTNVPITIIKKDASFFEFNEAAYQFLGYTKEEYKQLTVFTTNKYFKQENWKQHWEELEEKGSLIFTTQLLHRDASSIDVEIVASLIKYGDENLNFTIVKDITENKKLQERLKLVDFAFRNGATPILLLLPDASFYDFNEALLKLLGYTKEEFKDLSIPDIDPSFDKDFCKVAWEQFRQVKRATFNNKLKKKNGDLVEVELRNNLITYGEIEINFCFITDITEKKKNEEQLIRSNERYEFASMATSDVIWEWDIKENSNYFSPNFTKIFGHPVKPIEYGNDNIWRRTIHPDDLQMVLDNESKAIKKIFEKWEHSYRIRKLDGEYAFVLDRGFAIQDNTGEVIRLVGAIQDISEKKKAEEELIHSNLRYHYSTLATSDVIWEADLIKNQVFISKNFTTFFGHPVSEGLIPLGNNILSRNIHPDEVEEVFKSQSITLKHSDRWEGQYRIKKADGSYANVIDKTFAIKDDNGNIIRMVGAMQDITKKKEEELRLRLMELAILNTNDAILITEAEPIDEPGPKIVFVNEAFCIITGYNKEEVIGKNPRMLQCDETDRKVLTDFREKIERWEHAEMTIINKKKSGEKFWVNILATPLLDETGRFTHWIGVQRDVTKEIEAAQEKESLLEELVKNNKELSQFSYITSHNLRAPLTNLVAICKLINTSKITDSTTVKLIEGFKTSTNLLNDTLNDLINVLVIKQNVNLPITKMVFQETLDKIEASLSNTLITENVIVNADFTDAKEVDFSNIYLESVFMNLITNSIKYKHPERSPVISIKTSINEQNKICLTYRDNGIGMDMSRVRKNIFGLYKRFHQNSNGKGIGLYLIHSQITALGGKIDVDSTMDLGTTFTITFK